MTGPDISDIMTLRDARELYMHIEKKEILKGYNFPEKPGRDGYYRIYVKDMATRSGRRQLFAKTLEELEQRVYDYERGISGHSRKTFKEAYELVLYEKLKYIKNPEKVLSKQNTVNRNRCDYNRFFAGTGFECKFIDAITKSDIEQIVYFNLERYELREKAVLAMKGILKAAFALAYEEYWITDNVYERVNFTKYRGMISSDMDIDKRVHSEDEVIRILDELHKHQAKKPAYIPAYALEMQIIMGARRGEIPPLRRSDVRDTCVEISREQISVKKFDDVAEYCKIVEHTKTYKNRVFPRSTLLNAFLDRLFNVLDTYYPESEYLFPADTANGVISNNTVYNYYRRVCKKLGIRICREEIKGTHSFRRNAITDVVNASGGNVILAAQIFGNSPAVACKNYYTGARQDEALEALNKRKLS